MLFDFIKHYFFQLIIVSILSYLIGSISFPIIVTKAFIKDKDIRSIGSGNAGFTNVLRSVGILPAIITFAGDFFKCIIAVLIAKLIFSINIFVNMPPFYAAQYGAYIAGLFCVIGHIYPIFFGFRGGKSIVASFAMMIATHWQVGAIILAIFLIVLFLFKIVSLASITCAVLYPLVNIFVLKFWVFNSILDKFSSSYISFTMIIACLIATIVVKKHSGNIKRLLKGTEKKISFAKHK